MKHALSLGLFFLSLNAFAPLPMGMTDDETAFLRAILAHPDEDTPRLVYADWLQEHDRGEEAEFIRLQVGIANRTVKDAKDLERAQELEAIRYAALPEGLRSHRGMVRIRFVRGFPEEVVLHRDMVLGPNRGILRRILENAHFLRKLGLGATGTPAYEHWTGLDELVNPSVVDVTQRLASLTFHGIQVRPNQVRALLPHLHRLREFSVAAGVLNMEGVLEIVRSDLAPRLYRLDVGWFPRNAPTADLSAALANLAQRHPELREVSAQLGLLLPASMVTVRRLPPEESRCAEILNMLAH